MEKANLDSIYSKILKKIEAEGERNGDLIPYIPTDGTYTDMRDTKPNWWTNGFWAGMLWQLYHASGEDVFRTVAEKSTELMRNNLDTLFVELHHDVGFQFLHTAVAQYKITQDEEAKNLALHAATVLAGRFNVMGEFIRAWNLDRTGWMIIDTMMNLPLLYFASETIGDPRFADIANRHAHTAMRNLLREDGSCAHIAILDPVTGELLETPAGQGYADGSSWSRGQAWALYGFALSYRHSGKEEFLNAAKRSAHYFIANVALDDYAALCDFRSPEEPVIWDSTAAACAACGLLEIADHVPGFEKRLYRTHAQRILQKLSDSFCDFNPETDGIVGKGTAAYHRENDREVPIIYGDYFFVEGILRLLDKDIHLW